MARLTVWNVDHYEAEVDGVIYRGSITEALGILEDEKEYNERLPLKFTTVNNSFVQDQCKGCGNHPQNGGSGICNCILGMPKIT